MIDPKEIVKLPKLDTRVPQWDLNDLEERLCPICKTKIFLAKYKRPDSLIVNICKNCATYYVSPAPSSRQIEYFYERYDEKHRQENEMTHREMVNYFKEVDPHSDLRILELSTLMNLKGSKTLDVGFGRCDFMMRLVKLGAITYGVELDKKAIEMAHIIGLTNVVHGTIESIPDESKFDLITLNDLVEHPLEPLIIFRKAYSLLRPGGLLLVWTPNGASEHREELPIVFRVDLEHMQYLTSESIFHITKATGFNMVHLESLGFAALRSDKSSGRHLRLIKSILRSMIKNNSVLDDVVRLLRQHIFRLFSNNRRNERSGDYHLFCILAKPG